MRESRRRQRETYYDFGLKLYANYSSDPSFRDFLVSYVALGKKSDSREVSFTHPDPLMMQLADSWLQAYGRSRLRYRLHLPPGADVDRAKAFWAERLGVEPGEVKLDRRQAEANQVSRSSRTGLLGTLRIASNDTLLRIELQAWTDCARAEWRDAAESSQPTAPPR